MNRIFTHNGQIYLQVGDKAIKVDRWDKNGLPVINVKSETKTYPSGRKDVKVYVPCLTIKSKEEKIN